MKHFIVILEGKIDDWNGYDTYELLKDNIIAAETEEEAVETAIKKAMKDYDPEGPDSLRSFIKNAISHYSIAVLELAEPKVKSLNKTTKQVLALVPELEEEDE